MLIVLLSIMAFTFANTVDTFPTCPLLTWQLIVLPAIGHRFPSLMISVLSASDLNETDALQIGTIIQTSFPNITSATIQGGLGDVPRRILIQHLPRKLENFTLASHSLQGLSSALTLVPDFLKGLKSLTMADVWGFDAAEPFFQSFANAIQKFPRLESLYMHDILWEPVYRYTYWYQLQTKY
ncbi:expressed unknown protein [Seminavis robusta]|uniref:Uncharacterized protein n=1 Tax=Seminavis robusta TaxID=568900 RepID=A0A9N8DM84_9STRA|nr:expressed unknown protein [Seminavis robusta]|eukprot:Sro219_g090591.1  (182) ;mRNA; f:82345-82890